MQAVRKAGVREQPDGALLEHAGADAVLDVLAAAVLEHDRLDALEVEEVREQQAGRPGSHDSDLCPHLSEALSYRRGGRSIPNRAALAPRATDAPPACASPAVGERREMPRARERNAAPRAAGPIVLRLAPRARQRAASSAHSCANAS